MEFSTVAILSPGDMGHAVGQRLRENELDVITCLVGRSERTRVLAEKAGIRDVPSMEELVEQSDLIMSMTVSAAVPALCQEVASAIRKTGADTLFAECNAIAPQLTCDMEPIITEAGGRFVDVSIIGGPPRPGYSPHFYTSGDEATEFERLNDSGLTVIKLDGEVGQASGIKMCYAAMTKGTTALRTALLVAARRLDVYDDLIAEMEHSQAAALGAATQGMRRLPNVAYRWIGEMEEIASTFAHVGVTPDFHSGAAQVFREVDATFERDADLSDLADAVNRLAETNESA